jgi:hypothetical protein
MDESREGFSVYSTLIYCPHPQCRAPVLQVKAHHGIRSNTNLVSVVPDFTHPAGLGDVTFVPTSPLPLSAEVPKVVKDDYDEAYLIKQWSPKASAALSRRALQGMIRDYWGVSKGRLAEELAAIKDKCDHDLYEAMMALKAIGNIGAHPERDVALIVDIEPEEAEQLLELVRTLDQEWYVTRGRRKAHLSSIKALGEAKKAEQKGAAAGAAATAAPAGKGLA